MKNAYFNNEDLGLIISENQLKIVSSVKSDIATVIPSMEYLDWIDKNCDWHYHREAMLVLSGNGYFNLNDTVYPCQTGTFFLIDSKEKHDLYYPPFYDNFRHLWFRIINKTIFIGNLYSRINGITKNDKGFNYIFDEHNYAGLLFLNAWSRLTADLTANQDFDWVYLKHTVTGLLLELCKTRNDALLGKTELPIKLHHRTVIKVVAEHIQKTGGEKS